MKGWLPQSTDPTGAHSAFERQKHTEFGCSHKPLGRQAQRSRGVEDTRAVDVERQAPLVGQPSHGIGVFCRQSHSPAAVVRVLEANQARAREVDILGSNSLTHVLCAQRAVGLIGYGVRVHSAERGHAAGFI